VRLDGSWGAIIAAKPTRAADSAGAQAKRAIHPNQLARHPVSDWDAQENHRRFHRPQILKLVVKVFLTLSIQTSCTQQGDGSQVLRQPARVRRVNILPLTGSDRSLIA
jgi:hypothetical protein